MSVETEQAETPDVETEARNLGWVPEDEFKGPKDRWISAEEFVEKGKHVLPILANNNKRLQSELLTRDQKIANLEATVANSEKAIAAMEKHFTAATKARVAEAKKEIVEQIKVARESGDVDAEVALLEQLDSVKSDEKAAKAAHAKKEDVPSKKDEVQMPADIVQWTKDNSWYGTDKKLAKAMDRTCEDLREAGDTSTGAEFLEKAHKMMLKRLEYIKDFEEREKKVSKVEGGAPGRGGSSGSSSRSFANLPAEAKKACHDDNDILVGKNKRYKTQKDWEDAYAKMYYGMEE
jgi:hypothetical protein